MVAPVRIVIAGGSGFLGRHLANRWSDAGHDVVILTRRINPAIALRQVVWDAKTAGRWTDVLCTDGPVSIVNLAGKLVDCRPSPKNIAALKTSRVDATTALVQASQQLDRPVSHWLQSSTTAIYSDSGDTPLDEFSPIPEPGLPQMTGVASAWEDAVVGANTLNSTVLRSSIVLAAGCPAFDRLAFLVRYGAGGTVGSGRQWVSWIHLHDWLRIADASMGLAADIRLPNGVVIAASPHPVRNSELMSVLRRQFRRSGIASPAALVTLGALLLRTDPALALTGRFATSTVLREAGFTFRYPHLPATVNELVNSNH